MGLGSAPFELGKRQRLRLRSYISFVKVLWESTRHLQVDAMDMLTSGAGFLASEVSNGVVVVGRILTQGA